MYVPDPPGLREMSTLATPPEDRHPILTYVGAYEARQVSAAVRRELLREGQVFYVHNRVEDIDAVASHRLEHDDDPALLRVGVRDGQGHPLSQVPINLEDDKLPRLSVSCDLRRRHLEVALLLSA